MIYEPTDTIECSFANFLNQGYEFKILKLPQISLNEPDQQEVDNFFSEHRNTLKSI